MAAEEALKRAENVFANAIPKFRPTLLKRESLIQLGSTPFGAENPCQDIAIMPILETMVKTMIDQHWFVFLLRAATGTGKSLCVAPALLAAFGSGKVMLSEPQIEVVKMVSNSLVAIYPEFLKMGDIGFKTSVDKCLTPTNVSSLTVATTAIVSQELGDMVIRAKSGAPSEQVFIVLDEVHAKTNMALYEILNHCISLIKLSWPIGLVLMSANIESAPLIKYISTMLKLPSSHFSHLYADVSGDSVKRRTRVLEEDSKLMVNDIVDLIEEFFYGTKDENLFSFLTPEERKTDAMVFFEGTAIIKDFERCLLARERLANNVTFINGTSTNIKEFAENTHLLDKAVEKKGHCLHKRPAGGGHNSKNGPGDCNRAPHNFCLLPNYKF